MRRALRIAGLGLVVFAVLAVAASFFFPLVGGLFVASQAFWIGLVLLIVSLFVGR
jgi:FtsH-binding integral membrane protein